MAKGKGKHQKQDAPEEEDDISDEINRLVTTLKSGGWNCLLQALVSIGKQEGFSITDDLYARPVTSFSNARWPTVAPKFGLEAAQDIHQLNYFSVKRLSLPPSFHKLVMCIASQWLDVYQETTSQSKEAARVRLLEPVCCTRFLETCLIPLPPVVRPCMHTF